MNIITYKIKTYIIIVIATVVVVVVVVTFVPLFQMNVLLIIFVFKWFPIHVFTYHFT